MSKPLNVFEVEPNDCFDGLPEGTKWHNIRQALILDTGFKELIHVNWVAGPRNFQPWEVENFQRSMRLTVTAGYFQLTHEINLAWISQLVLDTGTAYSITPTKWLVS